MGNATIFFSNQYHDNGVMVIGAGALTIKLEKKKVF